MKIVLPVHHFPPHYSAGAELYTFRLARWLQNQGHSVEVVAVESIDSGSASEISATRDTYQGIAVWRLAYNIFAAPERQRWNFNNPLIGNWFAEYLRREQPDLAHFQAGYLLSAAPFQAAKQAEIPTVLTLHDYWFLCPRITLQRGDGSLCEKIPEDPAGCIWCRHTERRLYRELDRLSAGIVGAVARTTLLQKEAALIQERRNVLANVLQSVDHIVAPSHFLAQQYAPLTPANRVSILRYGLDLERFRNLSHPADQGPLRIGFTGQIAPHKGVHLLIEALKYLQPGKRTVELHLYGGLEALPQYVATLRAKAGNDPRVIFHGRFENQQAPTILAGFDVAVVPSIWFENSPLAISEAHAAGTPVITSRLGGMAELVRDDIDGLHFSANDAIDLARAIQRLIDEPALLGQLRSGIMLPPSIDSECKQLLQIYTQALQQSMAHSTPNQ